MNEKLYAVVNYKYRGAVGKELGKELVTFTDYWSAKQFAKRFIGAMASALPRGWGRLEVVRHEKGYGFHNGDHLFKITLDGKEFEAEEGDK